MIEESIKVYKNLVKARSEDCINYQKEIERLNNIINELNNMFYEKFRIKQNGSYTITETDYKDIEEILKEGK